MKWIALFVTNFVGVLNDNLLKNLISFISIAWIAKGNESLIITGATSCLVLPYVLFSPLAGKLSKRHSKAKILRILKLAEIPIMLIGIIGFFLESVAFVLLSMSLMGLQSCMYSPAKYGLIRDIGGKEGISFGTGSVEMLTFIGVLLGAFFAGAISDISWQFLAIAGKNVVLAFLLVMLAVIGWFTSKQINPEEEQSDRESNSIVNPLAFVRKSFVDAKESPGLNYVVLGLSFFWLIGSLLQMDIIIHCPQVYGLSNTQTSMIMALVAIGIGSGCGLAGVFSQRKVALHFVPYGGALMLLCPLVIYLGTPPVEYFTALVFLTAFAAGFFKVPLNAWIQDNVHGPQLGIMVAYNNLVTFLFILISAAIFPLLVTFGGTSSIFAAVAVFAATITIILWIKLIRPSGTL